MPIFTKFVKTPGGQVRFEATTKPPGMIEGFRNPIPPLPPPPGGGGIISKLIKFGGKLLAIPLYVILDFFGNVTPLESGDLPDWVKDVGGKEVIDKGQYSALPEIQASTDKVHIFGTYVAMNSSNGGCKVKGYWRTESAIPGNQVQSLTPVIDPANPSNGLVYIPTTGTVTKHPIKPIDEYGYNINFFTDTFVGGMYYTPPTSPCLNNTGVSTGHTFVYTKTAKQDKKPLDENYPGSTTGKITTKDSFEAGRALIDLLGAEEWRFAGFSKLPDFGAGNKYPQIDFIPLPTISNKLGIIPTPTPVPIPDPEPKPEIKPEINGGTKEIIEQKQGQKNEYPDLVPGKKYIKRITTKDSDGKIIKITVNPSEILNPTPTPVPDPKPVKITKTPDPEPKNNIIIFTPNPVPPPSIKQEKITDNDPKPFPPPIIPPVKPPNQTATDDCAGSCANRALAPGSPGLLNITGLLNGLLLQDPLLRRIDTTTTTTRDIVSHADYGLSKIQKFASTAWKATHGDKILNALTTAVVIHNGVMLSRGLGNSLADVATVTLQAMGLKDSEGKPFDVQQIVSEKLTQMIQGILGAGNYEALTAKLASYSRVYQSAANLADLTFSLFDSARNIAEASATNTGKIGNALREAGAVYEDAYEEMSEEYSPQNRAMRKLSGLTENVEEFTEKADRIGEVSSEVVEIRESFAELQSEREVLKNEVNTALDLKKEEKDLAKEDVQTKTDVNDIDFDPAPPEDN